MSGASHAWAERELHVQQVHRTLLHYGLQQQLYKYLGWAGKYTLQQLYVQGADSYTTQSILYRYYSYIVLVDAL